MSASKNHLDLIVLGGGAAGLMCALTAGRRGKRVLLLEASNKLGKKILMSGGGRCNFTNLEISADNFICENPHFVKSALGQYTQWDFINMVESAGIAYHEKAHGQLFCDDSAKQILQMLLDHCHTAKVRIEANVATQEVLRCQITDDFLVHTTLGKFSSNTLVVATGGMSVPTLGGATGLGYKLAKQFGLQLTPISAALVPFTLTGRWHDFAGALSGVSCQVCASVPGKSFTENMLFTHRGLSGPAILQLSNYWQLGEQVEIDFIPEVNAGDILCAAKREQPKARVDSILATYLPTSLAKALAVEFWPKKAVLDTPLQAFKDSQLRDLGDRLNCWTLLPSGTEGYRTAEVTRGGVSVAGISSKTMQNERVPGLYFIGEVLDVTGHLGGYNFQWAWSSGYVAGQNV